MEGCSELGFLYDIGDGIHQNKQKAVKLYTKACNGRYMGGCYNLGVLYYQGSQGVPQDKQKAKQLFGKACDGGDQSGCRGYRILNEQGI